MIRLTNVFVFFRVQMLAELHERKIAHRDVSPSNVIVDVEPDGTSHWKILDLATACTAGRIAGLPQKFSAELICQSICTYRSSIAYVANLCTSLWVVTSLR